jgi:hypothetical protein
MPAGAQGGLEALQDAHRYGLSIHLSAEFVVAMPPNSPASRRRANAISEARRSCWKRKKKKDKNSSQFFVGAAGPILNAFFARYGAAAPLIAVTR